MSKHNQLAKEQAVMKNQPKHDPVMVNKCSADVAMLNALTRYAHSSASAPTLHELSGHLGERRLALTQRQLLVSQIGRYRSNRDLQHLIKIARQGSDHTISRASQTSLYGSRYPIVIQMQNNTPQSFSEIDAMTGDVAVDFNPGEITRTAEGQGVRTLTIHWPGTANSGVTIGYGYDMGGRDRAQIIRHLCAAGVAQTNAERLADAAGLRGSLAESFVATHRGNEWATIDDVQRTALFNLIYPTYQNRARELATSLDPSPGRRVNAAARGREFVVPTEVFDRLHPVIREVLTDLTYPGQYSYSRHEAINPILMDSRLSTLEKLRAIRNYLNDPNTTGIGRRERVRLRTELISRAIRQMERRVTEMIENRREQLSQLPPVSSLQRNQLELELQGLKRAFANQNPILTNSEASQLTESVQRQQQAATTTAQSQPEAQWSAHPGIHRYFGNQQKYVALLPFYQARGITNPANYVQSNIVRVRFLGMSTPAHRDMLAPLATAENLLREQDVIPNISRFWSFNPRLSASGTLSQHAVGRAVDINAVENPHVRHPIDIQVIAAVTGVDLGQPQNAEDMRRASTTFQQDFTQDWVAKQPKNLQRRIRQRRQVLNRYARNGFLNLEQSLIDALTGAGFIWGGAWNRSKDFMHFELGW